MKSKKESSLLALALIGFILSFTSNFFIILSCSLFLKTVGPSYIPWYYIFFNMLSMALGFFLLSREISSARGLRAGLLLMAVIFLLTSLLFERYPWHAIFSIYIFSTLNFIYSVIFYWNYINTLFSIRDLKRYTGFFTAALFTGTISSGLLINPLLSVLPEKICFLLAALVCALLPALLPAAIKLHQQTAPPPPHPGEKPPLLPSGLLAIRILKLMILFTLLFGFIRYLVDYQFYRIIASSFSDTRSLSGFIGLFTSVVNSIIFLWQAGFLHRALRHFSVSSLYAFIAAVFMTMAALCLAWPQLAAVTAFQACSIIMFKALKQPSQNILIKSIAAPMRARANFLQGGIAESSSVMVSGVMIAALNVFHAPPQIFFLIALTGALLSLLLVPGLNRAYLESLLRNLIPASGRRSAESPGEPMLVLGGESPSSTREIAVLIRTTTDTERLLNILSALTHIGKKDEISQELAQVLARNPTSRVAAGIIDILARWRADERSWDVLPFLGHEDPVIRGKTVLYLIKISSQEAHIETAVRILYEMSVSGEAPVRRVALSIQGELGLACFAPSIGARFFDPDIRVRRQALVAAVKIGAPPLLVPFLYRMREYEENRRLALLINSIIWRVTGTFRNEVLAMTAPLLLKDKELVHRSITGLESTMDLELAAKALRSLPTAPATALIELIASSTLQDPLRKALERSLEKKEFSFIPLIRYVVARPHQAALALFFEKARTSGIREILSSEFCDEARPYLEGLHHRCRRQKLLHLGIIITVGYAHTDAFMGHLLSGDAREDLAAEIVESSGGDRELSTMVMRLIKNTGEEGSTEAPAL
ncbi:MAG: hypothetical protein RDV48_27040 [Candidatus Eremiobacteraeota bacterium]|nr:hypothetical protein [Candidatus Eremiobacteraeota bacterium]